MDLADRRVLGDELLLLVAQLGDVAAQHDRADAVAVVAERDRAQRHGDARAPRCRCATARGPVTTSGSDSSNCRFAGRMRVVTSLSDSPSSSSSKPIRLNAESALGLANVVMPSTSSRMRPSDARGAPRRGRGRGRQVGEVPRRDHAEQVVGAVVERDLLTRRRARLAEIRVAGEHADRWRGCSRVAASRTIGTARTRVGVSSNQSGEAESTMRAPLERLAHLRAPLRPHPVADDVAVEERRRPARAGVRDGDERVVARSAPRSRCRRRRGPPGAGRRRRGGGATRRRLRSTGPGRRRDR